MKITSNPISISPTLPYCPRTFDQETMSEVAVQLSGDPSHASAAATLQGVWLPLLSLLVAKDNFNRYMCTTCKT